MSSKTLDDESSIEDQDTHEHVTNIVFTFKGHVYQDSTARLEVSKLTPEEVRTALNRAPSKYAFWGSMLAEVDKMLAAKRVLYEMWLATHHSKYSATRMSETAKKYDIMVSYPSEYKAWQKLLIELEEVKAKLAVLVEAYKIQSRTLQSVSGSLRAELENLD